MRKKLENVFYLHTRKLLNFENIDVQHKIFIAFQAFQKSVLFPIGCDLFYQIKLWGKPKSKQKIAHNHRIAKNLAEKLGFEILCEPHTLSESVSFIRLFR